MDDEQIVKRIDSLVDEEHELEKLHTGTGLSDADRDRLKGLEVQLDQDPDQAESRSATVVEGYRQ
jgi:hypothetical protein